MHKISFLLKSCKKKSDLFIPCSWFFPNPQHLMP